MSEFRRNSMVTTTQFQNRNKNIATIVAVVFLLLALVEGWPYGFFTLLRLVVFGTSGFLAWLAYSAERQAWMWLFGFIALTFNLLIPVHLSRDLWKVIDLLVALLLVVSIFAFRLPRHGKSTKTVGEAE